MARNRHRARPSGQVDFNTTPMIDVTFLLIVFFLVAGRIASSSLAELDVPKPHRSQAIPTDKVKVEKVIVNVLLAKSEDGQVNPALAGEASHYEISRVKIDLDDTETLVAELKKRRSQSTAGEENFFVEIRADAGVNFGDVEPVLWAAAEAGIPKINITALLETGS
jgi:biopolymer transport protein ExbD